MMSRENEQSWKGIPADMLIDSGGEIYIDSNYIKQNFISKAELKAFLGSDKEALNREGDHKSDWLFEAIVKRLELDIRN